MIGFNQALEIDYITHAIYVLAGIGIVAAASIKLPEIRALPSRKNIRLFGLLALLFLAIVILTSGIGGDSISSAISHYGFVPVILRFAFGGVVVGWTEEFLFRGCLQRTLNVRFSSVTRIRVRQGTIITALVFGGLHAVNMLLGQSLSTTLEQITFAVFFGLVIGSFYDRTGDLAGAAWIHNMVDFANLVLPYVPL